MNYCAFRPALAAVVTASLLAASCTKGKRIKPFDKAYAPYISAYTTGVISRQGPVIIRLTEDVVSLSDVGSEASSGLFKFSPQVKGRSEWIDTRTIGFYPDEFLPSDRFYQVGFELAEVMSVQSKLRTFPFQLKTMPQAIAVQMEGIRTDAASGSTSLSVRGMLSSADVEQASKVQSVLSAKQNGQTLNIAWEQSVDGRNYPFIVEDVQRSESPSSVEVTWEGRAIGTKDKGKVEVTIPSISEFVVTNVRVRGEPDAFIEVEFSDPIHTDQDLRGLITVSGINNLNFITRENTVEVHFWRNPSGSYTVKVMPGILNTENKKLPKQGTYAITVEDIKPAVRLVGNGVIIPRSQGLVFPFEAVNVNAVDVTVIKIYEDNVLQFLQVNDLEGQSQLKRVGNPVKKKTIRLNESGPVVPNKWHRYGIKLDDLVNPDPGAIYRVSIGFRKMHSLYACGSETSNTEAAIATIEDNWDEMDNDESSYWDFYEDFYEGWNYDWQNRDNPCHDAYYNQSRFVSRNVIASDLGLVAKVGNDNKLLVTATDLLSAQPVSGVTIEVIDFQQQRMGRLSTDSKGQVTFSLSRKPFAIVATKDRQKGYLRLVDGNSLALGKFDVTGARSEKGVKGMLYGERGVWRPGDSLYLTFVLEDKQASLPEKHPVVFELFDPRGQSVEKKVRTTSVNGFYDFSTATHVNAPTGDYLAKVTVGGSTFTKTLKIETVKPNRLKINIDFWKAELAHDDEASGKLEVKWLHGAAAPKLRAVVEAGLSPSRTTFPTYPEFTFDDPVKSFQSESFYLFDGQLNDQGQATFALRVDVQSTAPGKLNANIKTRAFEKGGDFSVDVMSIPYHPFSSYTGIKLPKGDRARGMLLTDTNHVVEIVTVTTEGKPVSRDQVAVEFFKLDWQWWWESSGNLASYLSRTYVQPLQTDTIRTTNGKGKWTLRLDYPEWGRYFMRATDLTSGHSTGKIIYMDWPGWAGRGQREMGAGAAMLSFNSDKDKYNVGDVVELMIPSSEGGQALVSLESGYGVIKSSWAEAKKGETKVSFTATADMTPNVYAHVTLIQPHAQTANDLPIRLYGVIPIMVEDPKSHLEPVITTADTYRPDSKVSITVSEKNGREMNYTLGVVDEGLLDLTRFKTPDLWNHFYAKEALGVKTWDLFEQVLGAQGGELERLLAIGGDGEAEKPEAAQANRFKPVVQFFGPLHLKAGEKRTHTFTMPQYIGSVKVMLVVGHKGSYGKADKAVPVRKPLMVLATMPRVVGPQETLKLPVTVFAMEKHVKNVTVEVSVNDNFTIEGQTTKTIRFANTGEETVSFDLEVKPEIGVGKVRIRATSGNETAQHDIEIDVRNPNPIVTNIYADVVDAGNNWTTAYTPPGMAGTNKGALEVSNIPPLNLGKRLDWLIQYPHGCIEQTTSSVFPQLFVHDLLDVPKTHKTRMEQNIKAGIQRLLSFQQPSGGLSYWPGSSDNADDWSTSYAGHFMIEAQKRGYLVPDAFMKKWKAYQKKLANEWTASRRGGDYGYGTELIQAYRLYTLALAGSPEMGAMNRLREAKDLSHAAHWRLAAAYALAGQESAARDMVKNLPTSVPQYKDYAWTYGTAERDQAMILETLTLLKNRTLGMTLVRSLSDALCEPRWLGTQTTAYMLLAIAKFTGAASETRSMTFDYRFGKGGWQTVQSTSAMTQIDMAIKGTDAGEVEIRNKGNGMLYARVAVHGQPAIGDQVAYESNLKMKVQYKTTDGSRLDPKAIEQGSDFIAEVMLTHTGTLGNYDNMALSQIFPSGWEITNTRMDGFSSVSNTTVPEYQDIRDDRVYTYFDLNRSRTHTYRLAINASYQGRFYLPTVYCEAMYDASINSRQPGMWVEVVPAGSLPSAYGAKHGQPY